MLRLEEQKTLPQLFKIGSYLIYFWVQEGVPLEPVHVHISVNRPNKDSTKIWITKAGGTIVANNNSNISQHMQSCSRPRGT